MKRLSLAILVLIVGYAMLHMGCMDREPAPVCPVPTELNETDAMIGGFEGVDMLVVVDNSISMAEEQEILATAFFPLVNSLVNPLPGWSWPSADDVRIAIVTSDMGLSWGGQPYEEGDGWPGTNPCSASGDNGVFQTYASGMTIDIEHDVIPCDDSNSQCPTNWTCGNFDDEIGTCQAPGGDGTGQVCPDMNATWSETTETSPNDLMAFEVACLADQGTGGCGFEQQLQSAAAALSRSDQEAFVREESLLAILIVSDESDCSMEDGPAMFATDEIQDESGISEKNIACGENPDYLYDIEHYYTTYTGFKTSPNSVIFAAIIGVPDEGEACQGTGDTLGDCLDHPDMELVPVIKENSQGTDTWYFENACTRGTVTEAQPGRRYVKLANEEFGKMSFIYSICQADWGPAMEEIARLIASNLAGTCYEKPLDWDPSTRQAKCDVVVEFINPDGDDCPNDFDDDEPNVVEEEEDDEVERTFVYCRMPKLEAPKDCADVNVDDMNEEFGWFYCENLGREDFHDACTDGEDNDGDGKVDCEDDDEVDGCGSCQCCGGPDACTGLCKYMVQLTPDAEEASKQLSISVQCLQQFSFEDENCQEDSEKACNDDLDNDGNGIWDCEAVTVDEDEDNPHSADPNCCPMIKDGTDCKEINTDYCGGGAADKIDACVAQASLLGCNL